MAKESIYFKLKDIGGKRGLKRLKRELSPIPGVISVSVNPETDSLAVDFDNTGTDAAQIENRLSRSGFAAEARKSEEHTMRNGTGG